MQLWCSKNIQNYMTSEELASKFMVMMEKPATTPEEGKKIMIECLELIKVFVNTK